MLTKFSIDYMPLRQHTSRDFTHQTDDPIEAEEFLMYLLSTGSRIREIRHEGSPLVGVQFDRMIKIAADRCAALMLHTSLNIDSTSVMHRFGYSA